MPPVNAGVCGQFHDDGAQLPLTRNTFPASTITPLPVFDVTTRLSLLPMSPRMRRMPPCPSIVRPAEFTQTPLSGATLLRQKTSSAKSVGSAPAVAQPVRGPGLIPIAPPKKARTCRSTRTNTMP